MFELPLDFHLGVHRVALRPPPGQDRADAARVLVKAWHNLLRAEKVRQLHGLRKGNLLIPNLPASWGPWDTLEAMPCVVWLQVEAKQPAAKCMPRKQAPLVRRRVGHASLDWHGTITNSYNRIPWANREAIDNLVFESIKRWRRLQPTFIRRLEQRGKNATSDRGRQTALAIFFIQ